MKQFLFVCFDSHCDATDTYYYSIFGSNAAADSTTEADVELLIPCAGTIRNLYAEASSAPGAGDSWVITVRKNGAATDLTCTIAGGSDTNAQDESNSDTFSAGDRICVQVAPTGSPADNKDMSVCFEFEPDTDERFILAGGTFTGTNDSTTRYSSCGGVESAGGSSRDLQQIVIPFNCTAKAMYVRCSAAPGAGKTRTYTLDINEGAGGGTISVALGAADTSGNNTADESLSAGDRVCVKCVASSGVAAASWEVGLLVQPGTNGQFIIPANSIQVLAANATEYLSLTRGIPGTDESKRLGIAPDNSATSFKFDGASLYMLTAPGAGETFTTTLRENQSDPTPDLDIALGEATKAGSSAEELSPSGDYNNYSTKMVASAGCATDEFLLSYIGYITPAVAGLSIPIAMHHYMHQI